MGWTQILPSGDTRASYRDPDGRRVSRRFYYADDADAWLDHVGQEQRPDGEGE
ncbi:hypothetical protein ACFXKD_27595 [Nocardiopsis aegyptia]|uniref:hypothetical protein n=1 Tax=Nocardiopsis aegyptia TaxID=220378 RepID=UPI0036703EC7